MRYKFNEILLWFTIVNTAFYSCRKSNNENIAGQWHSTIKTDGGELPFYLKFVRNPDSTTYSSFAINGKENLDLDVPFFKNDSIHIPIEIFDAEIVAKVSGKNMTGYWKRLIGGTKYIQSEFNAQLTDKELFSLSSEKAESVDGKWATTFISQTNGDTTVSVGIFKQTGHKVLGTFLTTTGDYRYLAGVMDGDSLKLSTFDGTHLFLFKAKKTGNNLTGKFWSNIHGVENWSATLDPKAELPDVNKLTYLKPGFNKIEFSFPATDGKVLNISDKAFENRVKIIQIMGTWCPNCMDESKFLAPWYDKNKERGIEIIGLAYEKSNAMEVSGPKIDKMKKRFGIKYPVLLAGLKEGGDASKSLPMLNTVLGFPTTIIIDKKGIVRQIHTGFSGPGTGQYYEEWIQDFNLLIDKLVAE